MSHLVEICDFYVYVGCGFSQICELVMRIYLQLGEVIMCFCVSLTSERINSEYVLSN